MKNLLFRYVVAAALVFASFICGAADKLQAVITPDTVVEGEGFTLQLSSNTGVPELQELPEGFTYQGSSQSTSIINGASSYAVGYTFAAPAPGSYKIKPLKVKLNKELLYTPELTLTVVKASSGVPEIDNVFARAALMDKRSNYYVGEDIPLTVNVYYPRQIRLQLSYPVLDIGKSVFRDFRKVNPENSAFAQPEQGRKVIDGKLFEEISFITAFRPLAPGKLKVAGVVDCNILVPEKRRSRDPFDSFFGGGTQYRRIARKLPVETSDISIVPLPEVPEKGFFLNLIGSYSGKVTLSGSQINALEPVSLDVILNTGANSSFETLRVPE
ncbi:MAG: BatD family protein, partial [Lentisphaeria bacterium]|nr:BatD family protein [Lentisphaeria bacterium]